MQGVASIAPEFTTLSYSAAQFAVYRYYPDEPSNLAILPNVRVLSIQLSEGADPGVARFRYVFSQVDPTTDPTSFEQAMSVDCNLSNVVQNDERLVVLAWNADGDSTPIFDGFAQIPELSLDPHQEIVTFLALGVASRAWDNPVTGAAFRDSDDPIHGSDHETDIPVFFNPFGRPNATPENADSTNSAGESYPVLLDPLVVRSPDLRRNWTVSMAVRYLCFHENADEAYVDNPDGALIDSLLDSRSPKAGVLMDPSDTATYESHPIIAPSYLATAKPWPVAVHELIKPNGFGMTFRLEGDLNNGLTTRLDLFRRRDASSATYKDLWLQPSGEALDPSRSNLAAARLARDTTNVANQFRVISKPNRYEISFILAPGFSINAADCADFVSLSAFDRSSPLFSRSNHDRYRLYVLDETGDGHWDWKTSALSHDPASLSEVFPDDADGKRSYVIRRRPALGDLLTVDANRKPLRPRLSISTNYQNSAPGVWDGTGTWQPVTGGFDLLTDRLGIWINVPNPNAWSIGVPTDSGMPYSSGIVKGIEDQANAASTHFTLRLTCVIEGDQTLEAIAGKRPSSSTSYLRTRLINGSDRYLRSVVVANSEFNTSNDDIVVRDDTDVALAEASAKRLAYESGDVTGSVTIPRFTTSYRIGDRIRSIQGRNLSLRTNAGAPTDEGEVFPSVVGIRWEFERKQETVLYLSDSRGIS